MALTVILDTNVVLYYLANRLAQELPEGPVCVSVMTELELLAYPDMTADEQARITGFLSRVNIVELLPDVKHDAVELRRKHRLKLPDAIVAATSKVLRGELWTHDKQLASVAGLSVVIPPVSDL